MERGLEPLEFVCNLCGTNVSAAVDDISRETGQCPGCGSVSRLRSLAYLLGKSVLGSTSPVSEWPRRLDLRVVGVSDWPVFSRFYDGHVSYTNTQFDRDAYGSTAFLDITDPGSEYRGSCDAVICSDVLEHVEPPVQRAFGGLYSMLKPGGCLIFTVPYTFRQTVEHFPSLHDWSIEEVDGRQVLVNTTADGRIERMTDLVFHGGGEKVLEMRVFGRDDLLEHLRRAGFKNAAVWEDDCLRFGIRNGSAWSRPIIAYR